MKGILFCDIDGTLIPYGEKEIRPSLLSTLQEAIRKDWMLCIATGRVYDSVRQTLPMLEGSAYFSCSSGACLYYQGREAMPSEFLDRKTSRPPANSIVRSFSPFPRGCMRLVRSILIRTICLGSNILFRFR